MRGRGAGTILLVDDEQTARAVGQEILERAGFEVLTANDGGAAVRLFGERFEDVVLVLLDMTMPVMGGEETLEALRGIRADVPVILCSGYNESEAEERFVGKNIAGFLQKPYQMRDLIERVRSQIDLDQTAKDGTR